jgi:hypothetical protein
MSAEIITVAELQEYAARSGTTGLSSGQFAEKVAIAVDKIRQAILNDYTADSFELLTAETAPDDLRDTAFALALGLLTKGDAARAASITDAYTDASRALGYIAGGKTHFDQSPNAVLVKRGGGAGKMTSFNSPRELIFDRDNRSGGFNRRDPRL